MSGDSCAFSGYVNNIHTIAISGVNWDGSVPSYTEQCAAIMAVTYGKNSFTYRTDRNVKPPVVSCDTGSKLLKGNCCLAVIISDTTFYGQHIRSDD